MPCIEYTFWIKAFNQAGDSDFSPPVKVTTNFPGKCLYIKVITLFFKYLTITEYHEQN